VRFNQLEALKVLVDDIGHHAFVNPVDCNGNTALHLAVLEKRYEVCALLIKSISQESILDRRDQVTSLTLK